MIELEIYFDFILYLLYDNKYKIKSKIGANHMESLKIYKYMKKLYLEKDEKITLMKSQYKKLLNNNNPFSLSFEIDATSLSDNDIKMIVNYILKLEKFYTNVSFSFDVKKESTDKNANQLLQDCMYVLSIKNTEQRYSYIYDSVCDYLDTEFVKRNYCDFRNDQCIANRLGVSKKDIMGCCYSFDNKGGFYFNHRLCPYLENKKCTEKCITCKLFTCKYLKEKGISFPIEIFPLIPIFMDKKQQEIIKHNFFKTKSEMLSKLMKKNRIPYFLYVFFELYFVS